MDCLKLGTHGHHQRLGFLLLWCFARPLLQLTLADMLNQVEIKRLIWPLQNIPHFYHQKLLGCFCCMIWVIVHLYYEVLSNQLCSIWLNLGRQYIPVHFRIQSTASVICHIIIINPVTQCHWKPFMLITSHCSTMFHRWCCLLWIMSCSKPSPYFFSISAVQRILFQKWSGFFRAKSNLALFAPCGESSVYALVKSSLDCRLWLCLHNYVVQNRKVFPLHF